MEVQRSRLLRALVHVVQMVDQPDELVPFLQQLGRDHRKFGVLAEHYDAVGAALIGAIEHFSGDTFTPEVKAAWTEAYGIAANAMRTAAAAERGPASWLGRVVSHQRVGWDLARITVQASEAIPYRAGQYVSVETPQRPRLWRYLSPANAPRPDGSLEFHVRAVGSGWVSRAIVAHSRVGDTWRIGPPMGRMSSRAGFRRRPLLMVAGGTGMAPIKALLEEFGQRPTPRRTPALPRRAHLGRPLRHRRAPRAVLRPRLARRRAGGRARDDGRPRAARSAARWPTSSPGTGRGRATTCWSAARPP